MTVTLFVVKHSENVVRMYDDYSYWLFLPKFLRCSRALNLKNLCLVIVACSCGKKFKSLMVDWK